MDRARAVKSDPRPEKDPVASAFVVWLLRASGQVRVADPSDVDPRGAAPARAADSEARPDDDAPVRADIRFDGDAERSGSCRVRIGARHPRTPGRTGTTSM